MSLGELASGSDHVLLEHEGMFQCTRCRSKVPKAPYQACASWLQATCSKPTRAYPLRAVHLGHSVSHVSHRLVSLSNAIICEKCGNKGVAKLHLLAKPCPGQATDYGRRNIALALKGRLVDKPKPLFQFHPSVVKHTEDDQLVVQDHKALSTLRRQVAAIKKQGPPSVYNFDSMHDAASSSDLPIPEQQVSQYSMLNQDSASASDSD